MRLILGLEVQTEREELFLRLRRLAERLERIFNDPSVDLKLKLRAAEMIARLSSSASGIIRDYQIAELEREIEEIEQQA